MGSVGLSGGYDGGSRRSQDEVSTVHWLSL
jgi:hypothetical protein